MEQAARTILLVEDEMIIALAEKQWLKKEGYNVIHASTGEAAIEIVCSGRQSIDLILMDIDLGQGIDGTVAANEILKVHDLPVIFLSFHTEKEIVDKTKSVTSYGFVYKGSENTIKLASIEVAFRLFEANKNLLARKAELRKMQNELQNSNRQLRYFIEHAGISIAIFDREMRYLYVSNEFLKEYEFEGMDIIGKYHYELFPDLPDRWKNVHWQTVNGATMKAEEDIFPRKNGSVEWLRWECRPWYIDESEIGGIILHTEIITEKKKAQETILKLMTIFKNIKRGLVIGNMNTKGIEICNPEFARMHGWNEKDVIGRKFEEFYAPDDIGHIRENLRILWEKGVVNFETVHLRKDGTRFPVQVDIALIADEDGNARFTAANILDISEKKEFTARLKASESTFMSVFNNSSIGISLVSLDGDFLKVNKAFCSMSGYSEEELFKMTFRDITHPEDKGLNDEQTLKLIRGELESFQMEKRYFHKSGREFWVLLNAAAVRSEDGHPLYLVGQMQDITAKKEAEYKVAEYAQKLKNSNAVKEKYISILSHDLRGPVSGFVGLSEALVNDLGILSMDDIHEYSSIMFDSAKKVQALLLNLLDWSRLQKGDAVFEITEINMYEEIQNAISLYTQAGIAKQIAFVNSCNPDLLLYADRNVFSTLLRNLISNAVKFTGLKGRITVCGELTDGWIRVSVTDNGTGMDADTVNSIFTLGSVKSKRGTNNEDGSGLGLVLCHDLIEKCGGGMSIESTPGKGTTVNFKLPVNASQQA
ncbi:MAG: PAS domain S-box protein [Syntrophothermus sp.]